MSERIPHVIDRRGYALMGDSRGIVTPYEKGMKSGNGLKRITLK